MFFKICLLIKRILFYEKPLRVAIFKYLLSFFPTIRPHYESMLYEAALDAKKLSINKISVLELGVSYGNGIRSLEKYKKNIKKILDIDVDIYGFDMGTGMPISDNIYDPTFVWKSGEFSNNSNLNLKSKIFFGNISDTINQFIKLNPPPINLIIFDMDYYSSTSSFLNQIENLKKFLAPRVICYFDNLFSRHYICEFNGELKAINEFNNKNIDIKIGKLLDDVENYRFPMAKNGIYILHNFNHVDYDKYIGPNSENISLLN